MPMLFDITKSFLIKGIEIIIKQSTEADQSSINDIRIAITHQGRDTRVSAEKRIKLKELQDAIKNVSETRDELAIGVVEGLIFTAMENLTEICRAHNQSLWTTEGSLNKLHKNFLEEVKCKFFNSNAHSHVVDKIVSLSPDGNRQDSASKDDPLNILLFYLLQFQITIMYQNHNTNFKHPNGLINRLVKMLEQHIEQYQQNLKLVAEGSLNEAKVTFLNQQIILMKHNASDIIAEHRWDLFNNSLFTSAPDSLIDYLDKSKAEINAQWTIVTEDHLSDSENSFFCK